MDQIICFFVRDFYDHMSKTKKDIPGGAANFIINEAKAKALISHKVLAQNQSNFHTKSFSC